MTTQAEKAVYVYGILPGDVEYDEPPTGVGNPPSAVRLVHHRDIAALVSDVEVSNRLGTPDDLLVHEELLDASAAEVPVLPLRFGAVVANEDAVANELLEPYYDEFSAALQELEGYQEYIVRGRYVQEAILREILAEDSQAAALADQIRDADPAASREGRIQLGQLISERLADKRAQDTQKLSDALAERASMSVVRPPGDDLEAMHAAFLVKATDADEMVSEVQDLAADWEGRIELRIIGPVAAYDFVVTTGASPGG
jgi:Gas vesicle synthesis protein GvpL/GvpF